MANKSMRTLVEEFDRRYSTAAPKLPVLQIRQKEYVPLDGIREILRGMEAERNTGVPSPEPENPEERVDAAIAYFKNKTQKSISESRKNIIRLPWRHCAICRSMRDSLAGDVCIRENVTKNVIAAGEIRT